MSTPPDTLPGRWENETTGLTRRAIAKCLEGDPMTGREIAAVRDYLRLWIAYPDWQGPAIDGLRSGIDDLTTQPAIETWLSVAVRAGVDPI